MTTFVPSSTCTSALHRDGAALFCGVALVVVVAEHRDDGHFHSCEFIDERAHLLGPAMRRQVAAQGEHIRAAVDIGEQVAQRARAAAIEVDVADGGDPDLATVSRHRHPPCPATRRSP
jgi:hypothetical protein